MYSGENEFAWVLFTAMPSYVESNIVMYDSITTSANIVEEENNTQ